MPRVQLKHDTSDIMLPQLKSAPPATSRYEPVDHYGLIMAATDTLSKDFEIRNSWITTSHKGDRMAAWFDLKNPYDLDGLDDRSIQVGCLNAYDRTSSVKFPFGTGVSICTNLEVFGEFVLALRHSNGVNMAIGPMLSALNVYLNVNYTKHAQRMRRYADTVLTHQDASYILMELARKDLIPQKIAFQAFDDYVTNNRLNWKEPSSLYGLVNQITYASQKKNSVDQLSMAKSSALSTNHMRLWYELDNYSPETIEGESTTVSIQ